jgi:hypothetical protein
VAPNIIGAQPKQRAMTEHGSTTNRASSARPVPTFSTVEEAYTDLIERVEAVSHPLPRRRPRPRGRAEHLQKVLSAVLDYVSTIVVDTSHVAPGGSIDRKYPLGLISDLAGDVAGSIANAADDLAVGRV